MSASVAQVVLRPWSVDHIFAEGGPLFEQHYAEVANRKAFTLAPDESKYRALEELGKLISVAAYVDGALAGYAVTFIDAHIHYRNDVIAVNDVLFVAKEHRRGRLGIALIRETERLARERTGRVLTWHAKPGTALEALLPRLGYHVHETIYMKVL